MDVDPEELVAQARELTVLLHRAAERARQDFATSIAPLGVAPPLARVLLLLAQPMPMRAVADHLACDPSYVTGVADDLERAGLAERVTGQDRRVKLLALTAAGRTERARVVEAVAREAAVLRLAPAERDQLRALTARILT